MPANLTRIDKKRGALKHPFVCVPKDLGRVVGAGAIVGEW